MPHYQVNGILYHKGKVYRGGAEVELSEEVAAQLGDTVAPLALADPDKPLDQMTLKELQTVAQAANVEGYSKMRKPELYSVLTGIPVTEKAVADDGDESGSD